MTVRYNISLDLTNKKCLVVGGGQVAERKALSLLECGACVQLVSPEITHGLKFLSEEGKISHRQRCYQVSDLEGVFLVIGSTDQEDVNRQVAEDCSTRNIIVNIVDDPAKGNFFVPAVVKRGSLTIAVSTGGKSPILARRLREELENSYGPQYEEFLDMLGDLRENIISSVQNHKKRRDIFENLVDDTTLDLLKEGKLDMIKERLLKCLSR